MRPMTVRVLVSYTHEAVAHRDQCRGLADRLRDDGIEAWIDQYVAAPPEGWPRWMQQQITEANFVILVCTPTFRRRFEGTEAPGVGKGATWEGLIATQVLYDSGARNEKFVPVLVEDETEEAVPIVLRPFTRYRLWGGYEPLYRHLTGQPAVVPPPVGKTKVMPPAGRVVAAGGGQAPVVGPTTQVPAPSPMPPGAEAVLQARDRVRALYELLLLLFDTSELRMWLRFNAEGQVLVGALPGESVSKAEFVFKATDLLNRRGLIDAEFFDRLRQELPRQAAVIDYVRARWLGP
jgi:hypothetical protein